MSAILTPILRSVRVARRRLVLHAALNRLALAWVVALAAGLGWFLAEPWLLEAPPAWMRWAVLGGLAAVAAVAAVAWTVRTAPSRQHTALELDTRFGLRERVTTALGLDPRDLDTPAGQAVLADAAAKVEKLPVGTKFPVTLRWHSALIPALAGCVALVTFFYHPNTGRTADPGDPNNPANAPADPAFAALPKKNVAPFTKQNKPPELANRDKSEKLQELEAALNEMMRKYDIDSNRETPEKLREKATDITAMEEKVKKFEEEQAKKLEKLEEQLQQLDRLQKDPEFQDGPAAKLNDALAKGDLKKAQDEVDELKKKVKDKKLSKEDQQKLSRQLEKMKEEVQRLNRNKEREKELKDLIDKANKEGRDAESLERELEKVQQEGREAAEAAQDLAERFDKARKALEQGDLEEAAEQLEKAGQSLEQVEGDLQDLEDAREYLQRLKAEREAACKKCQGNKSGDELGDQDDADWSEATNPASGRRKENKDAKTASQDERVRGIFDPTRKKTYGGATRGPAFTKATTAELGPAIQEAAQTAPQTADEQRLTRDAKDTVKEYFQNLGGQSPGGNR